MITLKPKTKRGRQIVKEFGDKWWIHFERETLPIGPGPWLFISWLPHSAGTSNDRWVHATDDKHFEVVR